MKPAETFLKGMIAGGTLIYLLDPDRGSRRRHLIRDQVVHLNKKLEHGLGAAGRDVRNRSVGVAASARGMLRRDHAPDEVIEERVRSRVGRAVSAPSAIDVTVHEGRATLSGPVLLAEHAGLVSTVRRVRGVQEIEDRLDVHESAAGVPGLQHTNNPRRLPRSELMQDNWTPALRLLGGLAGASALVAGRRRGGVSGAASTALGTALLTRAATNLPTRQLLGVKAGRGAVTVQKSVKVAAPVEQVWDLWSRFENFPRFMAHLEEVHVTGPGRSHWVACGPAGTCFEWDAEITQWEPNELIAWRSVEGADVANSGQVRFQSTPDGGTRLDVRLAYTPPAGAVGHAVASLFGSGAKHALDDDMVRFKSLLEQGKASAHGHTVTRDELFRTGSAPVM